MIAVVRSKTKEYLLELRWFPMVISVFDRYDGSVTTSYNIGFHSTSRRTAIERDRMDTDGNVYDGAAQSYV